MTDKRRNEIREFVGNMEPDDFETMFNALGTRIEQTGGTMSVYVHNKTGDEFLLQKGKKVRKK